MSLYLTGFLSFKYGIVVLVIFIINLKTFDIL